MKIRSLIKFSIFWFLIYLLSCASGPKVKEIAALHYGEDEAEVVEILGEGSASLFFKLDGTNYSYLYYTTTITDQVYALLFADGRLFAVSEEKPPFDECISKFEWEVCFRSAISQMRTNNLSADEGDFSEALSEEEKIQKNRTGAAVIGTPALVVLWPFAVLAGMCAISDGQFHPIEDIEHSKQNSKCRESLHNIEQGLADLYPEASLGHVISTINKAHLDQDINNRIVELLYDMMDLTNIDKRIYGKSWRCGNEADLKLVILYGSENGRLIWVSRNIHTTPQGIASEPSRYMLQRYWNDLKHPDAKKWLCRAADAGHPEAQYRLGLLYENGSEGFPKDLVKSYIWYRFSASTGNYMRPADQAYRVSKSLTTNQLSDAEIIIRKWQPGQCEVDLSGISNSNQ